MRTLSLLSGIISITILSTVYAQMITKTFVHDGLTRSYSIYVPASYSASTPSTLVLNLHGAGSTGATQATYSNFNAIADTANIIVAYPNGTINTLTNSSFWNIGIAGQNVNDLDFLLQMIDSISTNYNIDESRIFSMGISNGGYMSYLLACQSSRFRAIASVAGSMTIYQYATCEQNAGIPIMQIHGTEDATVPYEGNTTSKAIETVVDFWVNKNNCNTTPIVSSVPNSNTSDNCSATHYLYQGGENGHTVEFYKVQNGGHTWPGAISVPTLGNTCQDFNASKEIWRFFNQYQNTAVASTDDLEYARMDVFPNPMTDYITIRCTKEIKSVYFTDLHGKMILQVTPPLTTQIETKDFPKGSYIIFIETEDGFLQKMLVK